jgi:molecular chaperone GrpE (heat shock protein)
MVRKLSRPFDVVYDPVRDDPPPVETKLVIIINHKPADTTKIREAMFEIRQMTKNLIPEVLKKHGIEKVEEIKVFL